MPRPLRFLFCWLLAAAPAGAVAVAGRTEPPEQPAEDQPVPSECEGRPRPEVNLFGLEAAPLDEPLVSDRPDFTESAVAVPYGRIQLEGGYTFTYDSGDGIRTQDHTYPELLLRVGLVEDFELRLGWVGWSHTEESFRTETRAGRSVRVTDSDDGGNDMSAGFKFHLLDQDGLFPDFGVITELSLPTGASGQTSGDVDPVAKLLWAYDLTDDLSVAGNVNFAVPTSDNGRYFETAASLSFSYAITDRVGSYVEYFGFYPSDRNQADTHFLNGGFTFLITNNLQFDVRAGMGLNDEADDFFTGAGFAIRF